MRVRPALARDVGRRDIQARLARVGAAARARRPRGARLNAVVAGMVLLVIAITAGAWAATGAIFDSSASTSAQLGAQRIFNGEQLTTGFIVQDRSSGSASDQSSQFVVAGDGRSATTKAWGTSFSGSRYVAFDLSAPVPRGLAITSPVFRLTFGSAAGSTACVYLDVVTISTNAVLASYGSAGSPAACVTGAAPVSTQVAVPVVTTSDMVDDLRIRVWGRDAAGGGMVLDEARLTASTPYVDVSTWPVRFVDAADGVMVSAPWMLQGP